MQHPKRIAVLEIAPVILAQLLQQNAEHKFKIIENGLPRCANIINTRLNMAGNIELLIESEEFEPVYAPDKPPTLKTPVVERVL